LAKQALILAPCPLRAFQRRTYLPPDATPIGAGGQSRSPHTGTFDPQDAVSAPRQLQRDPMLASRVGQAGTPGIGDDHEVHGFFPSFEEKVTKETKGREARQAVTAYE
jgi:hypothetical protein